MAKRRLGPERLDFHSLHWLHYAYLQQGRLREARARECDLTGVTIAHAPLALALASWQRPTS